MWRPQTATRQGIFGQRYLKFLHNAVGGSWMRPPNAKDTIPRGEIAGLFALPCHATGSLYSPTSLCLFTSPPKREAEAEALRITCEMARRVMRRNMPLARASSCSSSRGNGASDRRYTSGLCSFDTRLQPLGFWTQREGGAPEAFDKYRREGLLWSTPLALHIQP